MLATASLKYVYDLLPTNIKPKNSSPNLEDVGTLLDFHDNNVHLTPPSPKPQQAISTFCHRTLAMTTTSVITSGDDTNEITCWGFGDGAFTILVHIFSHNAQHF